MTLEHPASALTSAYTHVWVCKLMSDIHTKNKQTNHKNKPK